MLPIYLRPTTYEMRASYNKLKSAWFELLPMHPYNKAVTDPAKITPLAVQVNGARLAPKKEVQIEGHTQPSVTHSSKKLQDELQLVGFKIQQHQDNIKFLTAERNKLDDSILDKQVILGKYHTSITRQPVQDDGLETSYKKDETIAPILQHDKSPVSIFCLPNTHQDTQALASHQTLTKEVLGVVATLGKVDDENLSRHLSEYLGLDRMLAIVCKTQEGIKALEMYHKEGSLNNDTGIPGLYASLRRALTGRFMVICLGYLRPYAGDILPDDTQRRLDLPKPRLPNGDCPRGFLGFAVNMISMDMTNSFCLTADGYGLRETLFYHLFSHTQVYRTKAEMVDALPCITEGAISLDGGMIGGPGVYSLGSLEDVDVQFPIQSNISHLPTKYRETESEIKVLRWKREKLLENLQRESQMLDHAKLDFARIKEEYVKNMSNP